MRLFIAIDLPQEIKTYLRALQSRLPEAKMARTHDFHLTLKFLGASGENLRAPLEESLNEISFKPFTARLGQIGFFGGKKNPRVVWVGIETPPWLSTAVSQIENKMSRFGFEKENRFVPHVTLARIKNVEDRDNFESNLKKIEIKPLEFSVRHFYLFESRLSSRGAEHKKLQAFPSQK